MLPSVAAARLPWHHRAAQGERSGVRIALGVLLGAAGAFAMSRRSPSGHRPPQPRYAGDQRPGPADDRDQPPAQGEPDRPAPRPSPCEDGAANDERQERQSRWETRHEDDRRERDKSKAAGQQAQPGDANGGDSARVGPALEALLKEYKRQNAEARGQRPQEEAHNENVARLALASTIIAGAVLVTSVWQSFSVQGQLNAAITTNRAWVSVDPKMNKPITFDADGGRFSINVALKNVGHSPATGLRVAAIGGALVFGTPRSATRELEPACVKARAVTDAPMALFPDEVQTRELNVWIDRTEVERAILPATPIRGESLVPLLYVCAAYKDAGSGGTQARTAFVYTVGLKDDNPNAFKTVTTDGYELRADDFIIKRDFYSVGIAE